MITHSKTPFTLRSPDLEVQLRTIEESDCEILREWKNANRFAFFFQEIITPEQQLAWFRGYQKRTNDYVFIVSSHEMTIGCLGFRFVESQVDIYNVILGRPEMAGQGVMSQAMRLLCSYIVAGYSKDVGVKVLRSNPAVEWYRKNGFRERLAHDSYFEMELELGQFRPCSVQQVD